MEEIVLRLPRDRAETLHGILDYRIRLARAHGQKPKATSACELVRDELEQLLWPGIQGREAKPSPALVVEERAHDTPAEPKPKSDLPAWFLFEMADAPRRCRY